MTTDDRGDRPGTEHVAGKDKATFAKEFERICKLGSILPDAWMKAATGKPVTTQPLLDATAKALATKPATK